MYDPVHQPQEWMNDIYWAVKGAKTAGNVFLYKCYADVSWTDRAVKYKPSSAFTPITSPVKLADFLLKEMGLDKDGLPDVMDDKSVQELLHAGSCPRINSLVRIFGDRTKTFRLERIEMDNTTSSCAMSPVGSSQGEIFIMPAKCVYLARDNKEKEEGGTPNPGASEAAVGTMPSIKKEDKEPLVGWVPDGVIRADESNAQPPPTSPATRVMPAEPICILEARKYGWLIQPEDLFHMRDRPARHYKFVRWDWDEDNNQRTCTLRVSSGEVVGCTFDGIFPAADVYYTNPDAETIAFVEAERKRVKKEEEKKKKPDPTLISLADAVKFNFQVGPNTAVRFSKDSERYRFVHWINDLSRQVCVLTQDSGARVGSIVNCVPAVDVSFVNPDAALEALVEKERKKQKEEETEKKADPTQPPHNPGSVEVAAPSPPISTVADCFRNLKETVAARGFDVTLHSGDVQERLQIIERGSNLRGVLLRLSRSQPDAPVFCAVHLEGAYQPTGSVRGSLVDPLKKDGTNLGVDIETLLTGKAATFPILREAIASVEKEQQLKEKKEAAAALAQTPAPNPGYGLPLTMADVVEAGMIVPPSQRIKVVGDAVTDSSKVFGVNWVGVGGRVSLTVVAPVSDFGSNCIRTAEKCVLLNPDAAFVTKVRDILKLKKDRATLPPNPGSVEITVADVLAAGMTVPAKHSITVSNLMTPLRVFEFSHIDLFKNAELRLTAPASAGIGSIHIHGPEKCVLLNPDVGLVAEVREALKLKKDTVEKKAAPGSGKDFASSITAADVLNAGLLLPKRTLLFWSGSLQPKPIYEFLHWNENEHCQVRHPSGSHETSLDAQKLFLYSPEITIITQVQDALEKKKREKQSATVTQNPTPNPGSVKAVIPVADAATSDIHLITVADVHASGTRMKVGQRLRLVNDATQEYEYVKPQTTDICAVKNVRTGVVFDDFLSHRLLLQNPDAALVAEVRDALEKKKEAVVSQTPSPNPGSVEVVVVEEESIRVIHRNSKQRGILCGVERAPGCWIACRVGWVGEHMMELQVPGRLLDPLNKDGTNLGVDLETLLTGKPVTLSALREAIAAVEKEAPTPPPLSPNPGYGKTAPPISAPLVPVIEGPKYGPPYVPPVNLSAAEILAAGEGVPMLHLVYIPGEPPGQLYEFMSHDGKGSCTLRNKGRYSAVLSNVPTFHVFLVEPVDSALVQRVRHRPAPITRVVVGVQADDPQLFELKKQAEKNFIEAGNVVRSVDALIKHAADKK
jgi:hypothetical protein